MLRDSRIPLPLGCSLSSIISGPLSSMSCRTSSPSALLEVVPNKHSNLPGSLKKCAFFWGWPDHAEGRWMGEAYSGLDSSPQPPCSGDSLWVCKEVQASPAPAASLSRLGCWLMFWSLRVVLIFASNEFHPVCSGIFQLSKIFLNRGCISSQISDSTQLYALH